MRLSGSHIHDRIRTESYEEILGSNGGVIGELERVLTPEHVKEGVHIDFGADRALLGRVLEILGIDDALFEKPEFAHIRQVVLSHGITTAYLGKAIPAINKLPQLDGLDVLQSDAWQIYKESDIYPHIQPDSGNATSAIYVACGVGTPEGIIADTSKPGFVIGVTYRYLPELVDSEGYRTDDSLSYFVERARSAPHNGDSVTWKLGEYLGYSSLKLAMPSSRYFLRFGSPGYDNVSVSPNNHFQVIDNKVSLKPRSTDH